MEEGEKGVTFSRRLVFDDLTRSNRRRRKGGGFLLFTFLTLSNYITSLVDIQEKRKETKREVFT
ncbi:hypothetical protein MUK42_37750 [Musa troglodytarum]|uniref:Uncharacterized protein n=1 Tax=Musa troglodytarum TaxID=320322 RepID=A0A9E7GDR4_9LILI|nr:hypothetical protein MUK42_37750 [Musa troglodytarum]